MINSVVVLLSLHWLGNTSSYPDLWLQTSAGKCACRILAALTLQTLGWARH